jgi:uncharacterized Zn finger protein
VSASDRFGGRGDDWSGRRFVPPSRPIEVEGGIRASSQRGDIGESWWSRRFLSLLEAFGYGSRLARGRNYARRGQVLELDVAAGEVRAVVQGSRRQPYQVRIGLEPLDDADWRRAEQAMAERALFMARLLAGEMPRQIEEAFEACSLSLFPRSGSDLASGCTCPDWARPCKHVAAVFYLLAEAFDADPFLVFEWRGRTKEALIEDLRALRGTGGGAASAGPEVPEPAVADRPLAECVDGFWDAGPELAEVEVLPEAGEAPDGMVRQLGRLGVRLEGGQDVAEVVAGWYGTLASGAARRALGED